MWDLPFFVPRQRELYIKQTISNMIYLFCKICNYTCKKTMNETPSFLDHKNQ